MDLSIVGLVAMVLILALGHMRGRKRGAPPDRDPAVIAEFARRKRRQTMLILPVGAAMAGLMWMRFHPGSGMLPWVLGVTVIVVVAALAFTRRNWRCPACDAYAGRWAWQAGRCPHCHTALRQVRYADGLAGSGDDAG